MNKPRLIIICGLPASGKTSRAKKLASNPNYKHLSSDAIRYELYNNCEIQKDHARVFEIMRDRAIDYLNKGYSVIYDATNITRKARAAIISVAPKFASIECVLMWKDIESCKRDDATREHSVGEAVIDRMVKQFQAPFYDEGFDFIDIVKPDKYFGEYGDEYAHDIMSAMKIPHDNPNHSNNVLKHCSEAHRYISKKETGYEVKFAALIHDIGKPYVKSFTDRRGNTTEVAHYYQHQCVGAWMSYGFNYTTPYIAWLVSAHMDVFLNTKYYRNLPEFLKKDLELLHEADLAGH